MRSWTPLVLCALLALAPRVDAYDVDHKDICRLLRDADYALLVEVTGVATIETAVEPALGPHDTPVLLSFQRVDVRVLSAVGGRIVRENRDPRLPRYFLTGGRSYFNVSYLRYAKGERALVFLRESRATGFVHLHSSDEASREHFLFSAGAIERALARKEREPLLFLEALFREALSDPSMQARYLRKPELASDLHDSLGRSLALRLAELAGWRLVLESEETDDDEPPFFRQGPPLDRIEAALAAQAKDPSWRPCLGEPRRVLEALRKELEALRKYLEQLRED